MDVPVNPNHLYLYELGYVRIHQPTFDAETLTIVADEFGYQIEFVKPEDEEADSILEEADAPEDLIPARQS